MNTTRKLFFAISILMVFSVCAFAAEKGMNPTGAAFVKAFEANDLAAVMALYAPDATMFPPDGMVAHGTEEIRKGYAGLMDNNTIKSIAIKEAWNETHGDLSLGWGMFTLTMVPKTGGDPIVMEGRFSDVSKKIGGKWLYIVDHASVPFAPPPQTATTK